MKYLEHRPFTFWLSAVLASILVLFAAFVVGTQQGPPAVADGAVGPAIGVRSATAEKMMRAYGAVVTAGSTEDASDAVAELVEVAEGCVDGSAGWKSPRCAEVVSTGSELFEFLATHDETEPTERPQLLAMRRPVGTAVAAVVGETP